MNILVLMNSILSMLPTGTAGYLVAYFGHLYPGCFASNQKQETRL